MSRDTYGTCYLPKGKKGEEKALIHYERILEYYYRTRTEDEFLEGYSAPKNPELMRVFRDLKLVEHLGTGVRKILKKYNKDVYHFFPHFIRVSIKYNQNQFEYDSGNKYHIDFKGLSKIQEGIIDLLLDDSTLTQLELARILGVGERTIRYNMKELTERNYIVRIGSNKTGQWQIVIK